MQQQPAPAAAAAVPPHAPLIFSVSLCLFDLHVGNSIAYTYPPPVHGTAEPVEPENIVGDVKIHDFAFPDGGHDVASDSVAFLVRLKKPLRIDTAGRVVVDDPSPPAAAAVATSASIAFDLETDEKNKSATAAATQETTSPLVLRPEQDAEARCRAILAHFNRGKDPQVLIDKFKEKGDKGVPALYRHCITKYKVDAPPLPAPAPSASAASAASVDALPSDDISPSVRELLLQDSDALRAAIVGGGGASAAADDHATSSSSPTASVGREASFPEDDGAKAAPAAAPPTATAVVGKTSSNSKPTFLDVPQSILYGTALYVRAADAAVERGALQRAVLVLSRVPLYRPLVELLQHRAGKILGDASYRNDDERLRRLVDGLYAEFSDIFRPCVSSFRIVEPLFTELDGGQRVFLPRVGRLHNPASPLVLLGFRHSVVNLLRLLGATHSALLLHAILSRMPVIVIGRTAAEVSDAVCACIHLCRPLPIDIAHFSPYSPISVLDKLVAAATEESNAKKRRNAAAAAAASSPSQKKGGSATPSPVRGAAAANEHSAEDEVALTTPVAVIGATNAFIAHKQFDGICKLILPSLAEEVTAASGDDDGDSARHNHHHGANVALVQYPASSALHKKGASAFLPRTFLSRVKGLVAIAQEADASEIHVRSLVLALNFALSIEIRTSYGDVGAAFASTADRNVVSTPLTTSMPASPVAASSSNIAAAATTSSSASPANKKATTTATVAAPALDAVKQDSSCGFDMIDSDVASPTSPGSRAAVAGSPNDASAASPTTTTTTVAAAAAVVLNSFPALRANSRDEARLISSLENALHSYVLERQNERKTVITVHKWFSAVRQMLAEVAASSSEQQRALFDGLMMTMASADTSNNSGNANSGSGIGNTTVTRDPAILAAFNAEDAAAIHRDLTNLHQPAEDAGSFLTGEDILCTLGEQQRLNRQDLGRFVEHYRRRAGAAVDQLCNKGNSGSRSRPANELFCDLFSLPGIECYEMHREVLLAQTSATVVSFAPCEGAEQSDPNRPPKPFWEGVDCTVSLSARYLCLDTTNQSIGSKALNTIGKLLPKGDTYYDQKLVGGYYAHQVIPIAAVARIEVIEAVSGGNMLTNTVIPRDLHTLRLHLSVDETPAESAAASSSSSVVVRGERKVWRAKLDLRLSQKSGVSQLLFLVVNKHHDFTQAIRRIQSPSESFNNTSGGGGATSSSSSSTGGIDLGRFYGRVKGIITPVALGPQRLRDIAAIVIDEVYENERSYPIVGWTKKLLPHDPPAFSDRCGIRPRSKESVTLPPGYEWAGDWSLVPYYQDRTAPEKWEEEIQKVIAAATDSNSSKPMNPDDVMWAYGTFWRLADFHGAAFPICSIRRRRWVRQRRLIVNKDGGAATGTAGAAAAAAKAPAESAVVSMTALQQQRDREAAAADAEEARRAVESPLSPRPVSGGGAGGASSASSPSSPDLQNAFAFASHLSSIETLERRQTPSMGRGGNRSNSNFNDDD